MQLKAFDFLNIYNMLVVVATIWQQKIGERMPYR